MPAAGADRPQAECRPRRGNDGDFDTGRRRQTNLGLAPNVAGLLCYVPCCIGFVFSVVAAIVEKQSRFVRFHAFQSLLLHAAAFVLGVGLVSRPDRPSRWRAWASVGLLLSLVAMVVGVASPRRRRSS